MKTAVLPERPGLSSARLERLIQRAVECSKLDLEGRRVLTEAATGAYAVTPVIAAVSGADVVALTSDSAHGSASQAELQTMTLAERFGVADRIRTTDKKSPDLFAEADIVTNSGHVRPIAGIYADALRDSAVIPLMFESWEVQAGREDLDLAALRARGIRIAGTNERHPLVNVFSFLGPMAVAQLADAGVSAYMGSIELLCDNPFRPYLVSGLAAAGAFVSVPEDVESLLRRPQPEALVVALTPTGTPVLSRAQLSLIAETWPGTVVSQFWGDIDRADAVVSGVPLWPLADPGQGHMGVLPARVGPEPIVQLQMGGLKVAEILCKEPAMRTLEDWEWLDEI